MQRRHLDFFYEALPGYDQAVPAPHAAGSGDRSRSEVCNLPTRDMERWGDAMFVTPGVVIDGSCTPFAGDSPRHPNPLGSSYYDDWPIRRCRQADPWAIRWIADTRESAHQIPTANGR